MIVHSSSLNDYKKLQSQIFIFTILLLPVYLKLCKHGLIYYFCLANSASRDYFLKNAEAENLERTDLNVNNVKASITPSFIGCEVNVVIPTEEKEVTVSFQSAGAISLPIESNSYIAALNGKFSFQMQAGNLDFRILMISILKT